MTVKTKRGINKIKPYLHILPHVARESDPDVIHELQKKKEQARKDWMLQEHTRVPVDILCATVGGFTAT